MAKRNVYMVQVDHLYGNKERSVYLPYATGLLAAYAWSDVEIKKAYCLAGFIYCREDIDKAVDALESPYLVGFSCYIWNTEYNKAFAAKLKAKYPGCTVVFGGHNVPRGTSMLEQYPFIDVLVHGEGEEAFKSILLALKHNKAFGDIPSVSYRDRENKLVSNAAAPPAKLDFPSPYLEGIFEPLLRESGFNFCAVIETNRGCPNRCSYCDWGMLGSKLRQFPTERVYGEIDWMAEHKIEYFWCADSSFGLFKRDHAIVDRLIKTKLDTGYPKVFKVNYAEHRETEVYELCRRLNEVDMNKGATLSFQSLDPVVLKNIGRINMPMERFAQMMALYNSAEIATYAELILGLPGETYDSFRRGIEMLLEAGQHNALNVHALILLVNSHMADPAYIKKFGIKTVRAQFAQFHCTKEDNDIPEYYDLVIATNSMNSAMWARSTLFFIYIQTFHQLGLLQFFAIYLFHEKNIRYTDFYERLINWSAENDTTVCGKVFGKFSAMLAGIPEGNGSRSYTNSRYGDITWPLEEGAFLDILPQTQRFYMETGTFLHSFGIENSVYRSLLDYQIAMLKLPGKHKDEVTLDYDFHNYFRSIFVHDYKPLKKAVNILHLKDSRAAASWKEYAVENVWYGRNDGRCLFSDIIIENSD